MSTPFMRRDWTTIGEHMLVNSEGVRARVARAIDALDWDGFDPHATVQVSQDWLDEVTFAIKKIPLSQPDKIVFSDALAPLRLYGVECQEINGRVRYYVINQVGDYFVVAADFFPNELAYRQSRNATR